MASGSFSAQKTSDMPVRGARKFHCPRCGALAQQAWNDLLIESGGGFSSVSDDESRESNGIGTSAVTWSMSTCFACKHSTVWRGRQVIYPQSNNLPAPHPRMPDGAVALYEEARAVAVVSRRAGAALARAALESLLSEVRPDLPGRLDDRIAALQAEVSIGLWQILSVLRHTGNVSLHGSDSGDGLVAIVMDDDGSTLNLLFGAINDLVDELVARPEQAAELFALLPEGVAATALRKAGLPPVPIPVPAEPESAPAE